jgi:site-specific recombinase XerD
VIVDALVSPPYYRLMFALSPLDDAALIDLLETVWGLRHTFATELANSDVSVYALMKLLGHESMVTSQRYVTAAGTETRTAAAQNKLYGLLEQER